MKNDKYRFFFEHMPTSAIVSKKDYTIEEWNKEAEYLFGYTKEEAVGSNLIDLLYSEKNEVDPDDLLSNLKNTLRDNKRSRNINYDRTKQGNHILCEWFDLPYSSPEGEYIFSVAKDITKDKEILDSLSTSVEKKDFMMQEIHHRLKNNLTMITSLINLRMQENKEEGSLQDIQSKIYAVSTLYEKLYKEGETSEIDLGAYLEDIIYSIFATLCHVSYDIRIDADEIYAPPETAIALALISNEIATNAIKYGFLEDEENSFSVAMKKDSATGNYIYTLANTGNPFPEDIEIGTCSSLGMQLIETLVEQLQGTLELNKKPSAEYRLSIPGDKFSSRR